MQFFLSLIRLFCVIAFCGVLMVMPLLAQERAQETLITGIDAPALLRALGIEGGSAPVRLGGLVDYPLSGKTTVPARSLAVGVFATADEAHWMFQQFQTRASIAPNITSSTVGDEFAHWRRREGTPHWGGRCMLRRMNCIINFGYTGQPAAAEQLAQQIDGLLRTSATIAPKGMAIALPAVTLQAPRMLPCGGGLGASPAIHVHCATPIRIGGAATAGLVADGTVNILSPLDKPGTFPLTITLATAENVIFTNTVSYRVVSKDEYAAMNPIPWNDPIFSLYFLRNPQQPWGAQPERTWEWITFSHGTFGPLGTNGEREQAQQRALDDFRRMINPAWLPDASFIQTALDHETNPPTPVAYCNYTVNGCHLAVLARTGKTLLIYAEQPDPLPRGMKPLTATNLLTAEALATKILSGHLTPKYQEQTCHRYRAFLPKGPYQKVRILLVSIGSPRVLNLTLPGY